MKFIFCSLFIFLLASCGGGSGSDATGANGGSIPVGTTVFTVTATNAPSSYTINGLENPTITLQKNVSYTFNVSASGHPFYIMTVQGTNTSNAQTNGVTNGGVQSGTLTFTVPPGALSTLYYDCSNHSAMSGVIHITN